MLTHLTALLAQADPVVVVAPPGVTWPQFWLTLLMSLPAIIAAVVAAATSVRNAWKINEVHTQINGRMEELLAARTAQARAAGAEEGRAAAPAPEEITRIEQTLREFVAYAHSRNHDVLNASQATQNRTEVARLDITAKVDAVAADVRALALALAARAPAPAGAAPAGAAPAPEVK